MAKKILVVEDIEDSRSILVVMLQRYCGYETMEAATGFEAVEKATADKPDLIVMDLGLPGMSGVDAAKILKHNPSTAHIPIVAHQPGVPRSGLKEHERQEWLSFFESSVLFKMMKETIENLFLGLPHCYP